MAINPKTAVELKLGDLEIGAVEIKNPTDDTRAVVGANGLYVDVRASVLPTGAATETTLSALNTKVTACNTGAVVVTTSALPSGAATETTLSALNTKVTACNTGAVTVSASALPTGAATETTLSALNTKVTACNTGAVTVSASALPSGAATETTLSALNTKVTACNTGAVVVTTSALPSGAATETTLATQVQYAATPTVYNVAMAGANTEYSQALPANTKKFIIKLRTTVDVLKVKFGAAGNYMTINAGSSYNEDNLKLASQTIYFESPTAAMTAEIVAWA